MSVAPAHPPVHAYGGENPFEVIDSKWGRLERWRALAMATGETSALTELSKQVRSDSANIAARHNAREAELNAREDAVSARELQHAVAVTQFVDFVGQASVLFDKIQKARADAIAGEQEPLAHPPGHPGDPSDPSKKPEPSLALEDDTQSPDGSLHVIAAKEDDPDAEGDNIAETSSSTSPGNPSVTDGDFLRLHHPVSTDAEFVDPELPHPPTEFQQPIGAGLDEN
jgi:hypothetical protein